MKKFFDSALFALLSVSASLSISANITFVQQCEQQLQPAYVVVQPIVVTVEKEVRRAPIRQLSKEGHGDSSLKERISNAHTVAMGTMSYEVDIDYLVNDRDEVCYRFGVNVKAGYRPLVISIASEIPEGSCSYNEVLEHEYQHVEAYKKFAPELAKLIQKRLTEKFGNEVRYGKTYEQVIAELTALADKETKAALASEMLKAHSLHHAIDTREESTRVTMSCDGELVRILTEQIASRN